MADTEDFSSLDPLGPEYGRSDLPTMDSKGLSAFEGDTLKDPIINFPVVPKIQNLELPQHDVHQYVVNKAPKVQGVPSPKLDFNAFKNAHRNYTLAKMATGADKSTYGKIYSYNAGPDGNAFYDRYAAYGPETFAKVGFSPLRDNEALFNSRTTMWDDHKRMMQNSFWPLFANGFVAGPKSLGKMLTGDFTGTDLEESRAYTDAAAIGQTTKSGWGMGFANNLLMNFAYSAGIITEAIAEEAVAIALAPETMGGSVFLATANATRNLSKLGTGFKLLKGVEATKDVTNGLRAVNNTLKAVDNVKDARTFWQTAKGVVTSTFSPLKNTFTNLGDINQIVTKGGKSYNLTNLAKIYKTAGGFYKDVRNFNMALSEARLEAGIVENQIYDNGYNQYYDKFGEAPSDKVQKELLRNAKEGSLDTLYWNTALIYVSNSITFNNLLGPRGGVGGFMRNTMKEVGSIGGGKFGSLGKVIYNQGKKVFQFQANTAKGLVKSWASQPIYKSAMGTLAYFKRNFTEGIQENLQEVISGANEKYYSDSFEQSAIRSHEYHKGLSRYNLKSQNKYLTEEFKGQFSARGAETFASGFFMGMLAAPLNAAVPNMLVGYNRMFNKEAYQKFKADKLEITKGVIENLNSIGIKEFLDNKIFNLSTQEAVATIKRTGTKKEAHDADMEGFIKQMSHVLRNGVMDVYIEKLQAEKQLSPEEFEERVPNIPKGEGAKYLAKIDDVVARAKKLEKRYKYYTDKHPNPVTAANLPPINTPEYEDAIALHAAWEDGIEKAIYFNEAFENTMQRKVDIESTFVAEAPLKNMSSRDSAVLFNDKELQNEIGLLKNEVDSLKDLTDPKSQEQYAAKVRKLAVMEKLYSASTGFKNFFNRYDNAEQVRAALQKDKGSEPVTDEEVEAALSSVLGEFTEDNKEKITRDYEGAYKEYLQELASVNGDYIFDQKIDESFTLLIDHHALDHESGRLMRYVNLLHDPQGFLDMVDRNRQWMKDLYKKRGKIYEKMVTEELNMVIHNSLLNALANNGIYVSVEAFEEWEESGVPPEEFFDNTRKLIVPKGTPDYDIYYQLFEQASELKNEKTNPLRESLDTELKATLDTLDEQLEKELESVPKIDSKVEVATIEMENDIPITVNKINTELGPNQYAEALVTTEEGGKETTLFFKHEDGTLRYNNETGAVVKGATLKETFEKVNIFSMESVADPAYAQPIIDRYNDLKAEAIQEYALNKEKLEEEDTTPKEEFVPITTDMEPDSMPATLYNELYKLFKEQYLNKLNSEEFVNMTAEEERNVFRTFIQGSKEAKKIIEDFNAEVQLKADEKVTKKTTEKEDFDFLYQGKTVNTASIKTIAELRKYQERFKKSLKTLEDVKSPTAEDIAQIMAYQLLIADFEKLITTRSKVGRTPAMQKSIDLVTKLQSMQEGIEQSTLGYMINDQLHERVSNEIAKLESKKYAYKNQGSVNTAFYLNIGLENSDPKNKVNLTEANIDSFIEELRTRNLAGFSEYTYKKLKENLVNTLSDETNLPNATNQDILDLITTTVSEETYEESRISGNYLDLQVKNLFDGQPVVFNEDNITKKAFDNLFGPKGILTALKAKVDAGELYIVSQGIRVYDSELNIAGEIDLLMVDSTGQITIVDVKSGLVDKWNGFNDPNNSNSKLENYQLQQTAYANLLQRMLGVEAKIALLPIQMDREDETGKILKAGKPTKKDLLTSDIFIELDKGPVQERINSIIPLKEVTSAPIVTPTNTTTDTNIVQENKPRKPGFKNTIVKKEESATKSGVAEYKTYAVDENGNEKLMRTSGGIRTTVGELAPASQNSSLFYAEDENGDFTILKLDPNTRILITRTSEGNDSRGNYEQRTSVRLIDVAFGEGDIEAEFLTTKDIFSTPIYKTNTTTTDTEADIIQTNKPNIQTVGNVTFGTANKQGQTDNNEDAVYVDTQKGVFILADGMGGEGMLTLSPTQASKLVINSLLGKPEKNFTDLIYEEYLKNKNITVNEIVVFLESKGFKKPNTIFIGPILTAFKTKGTLTDKKGFRSGATALKAQKINKNTYQIEKVGDTVFFVVDKNGKVTQQHGLSDVSTTQGYMFSIKDGKPFNSTPKTDNFTITLNEGETLVLATDFIETDKAIQDFINSDFGKNLDFDKFQKNNKVDDSTFITIKYDAELAALKSTPSTTADVERRSKEELFPIDSLHKAKESGDTLKVIGYTEKGVRFQIQTEGTIKPTRNVIFSELKRYIKEGKLSSDIYAELAALGTDTKADIKSKTKEEVSLRESLTYAKGNKIGDQRVAFDIIINGNEVGSVSLAKKDKDYYVHTVEINESSKGKGYAGETYKIIAKKLADEGYGFTSARESTMEPEAIRVWEKLVNLGFAVKNKDNSFTYKQQPTTDTNADIERRNQYSIDEINRAFIGEATYFGPNWNPSDLATIVENTETVYAESKQEAIDKINKLYAKELAALEGTETTVNTEYYESPYGTIAANYLFTGGKGVILSTDYLLQALTAVFPYSGKAIDNIRNKYANELSQILKDDINTDIYNSVMQEIRDAINNIYGNEKANKIFEKILKNATGFTLSREGNQVSSDAEKLNEEQATLEGTETNNTEDGEIIPSETEEITEVFVADSDRVTVAMIKDQLDKANTAQEVQTVVDNLNISVASEFVFNEDITEMVELIKAKKESLVVPQDMPIISESLEKGTELVAKKNIFTGAKNIVYATQDSILMVTNVDTVNKTVSVKALNSNKTIKIKFSDMNENFGLKTNLMNGTEKPDEPLTSEDKTFVSESIDLTTTFIEDKTKIDAIEKAASAKTIQELEDDLLEDIFC